MPPVSTTVPDLSISSVNLAIAAIFSGVGGGLSLPSYVMRKRMMMSPCSGGFMSPTNEGDPDRHGGSFFAGAWRWREGLYDPRGFVARPLQLPSDDKHSTS